MVTLVSHIWKPSKSRTITIDSFVPVPRGTLATAPTMLNWPSKDPADILDYQLNIEPALVGHDSERRCGGRSQSAWRPRRGQYCCRRIQGGCVAVQRPGRSDLQRHGKNH